MKGIKFMKIFEMIDEENALSIGVLLYYEKEHTYIIELQDSLDEWTAPLLFASYVKKNIYTIPREISFLWVKERVIPSGRQNISDILAHHKLQSYDEMKFLEISEGRCSQDSLYIRKIKNLPEYVVKRNQKNITDCVICQDKALLCFFANDVIKKVQLSKLENVEGIDKILSNENLFQSGKVGTGGYSVTFNDSIDIPAGILYEEGEQIPLQRNDFIAFVQKNVLDTTESCNILECSRQNVSYMVKQQQLVPIKEEVKGNLYLKGEILKNKW
jgi:hypothetical protein